MWGTAEFSVEKCFLWKTFLLPSCWVSTSSVPGSSPEWTGLRSLPPPPICPNSVVLENSGLKKLSVTHQSFFCQNFICKHFCCHLVLLSPAFCLFCVSSLSWPDIPLFTNRHKIPWNRSDLAVLLRTAHGFSNMPYFEYFGFVIIFLGLSDFSHLNS